MNLILFSEDDFQNYSHLGMLAVPFSDSRGLHMRKVLKLVPGDSVKIGMVGDSGYSVMTVAKLDEKSIILMPGSEFIASPPLVPVTMIIGQVRPICMKRILRDAVCLGISRVILTLGENCEKSYADSGIYRNGEYLKYLIDGGMQAGSTLITHVDFASSVSEAVKMTSAVRQKLLLDNVIGALSMGSINLEKESTVLSIGPERGWTDDERRLFIDAGFDPVLMGKRILRTETAVPVGGGILLSILGLL